MMDLFYLPTPETFTVFFNRLAQACTRFSLKIVLLGPIWSQLMGELLMIEMLAILKPLILSMRTVGELVRTCG